MNWPFVSRTRLDLLQHNFEEARRLHHAQVETLTAALADEKARYAKDIDFYRAALALKDTRYDVLLAKYEALANPQVNRPAMLAPVRKPADEAIETVVAQFGGSSRLRRQLQRFVLKERSLENANEQAIADRVLNWPAQQDEDEVVA